MYKLPVDSDILRLSSSLSPPPPSATNDQPIGTSSPPADYQKPPSAYTNEVPILCVKLGINAPTYLFDRIPGTQASFDAYALFPPDVPIKGRRGHVKAVYTKKNAKERCAEKVYAELKALEAQRNKEEETTVAPEEQLRFEAQVGFESNSSRSSSLPPAPSSPVPCNSTFTMQVPIICHMLGLDAPRYVFDRVGGTLACFNVHAVFPAKANIPGRVGEVKNVYSKKAAKEKCAEKVYATVKDLETPRGRSPDSAVSSTFQEAGTTAFSGQVPDLCTRLGFKPATVHLRQGRRQQIDV